MPTGCAAPGIQRDWSRSHCGVRGGLVAGVPGAGTVSAELCQSLWQRGTARAGGKGGVVGRAGACLALLALRCLVPGVWDLQWT